MSSREKPVFISDSGDNPTAGGPGDNTSFLARALRLGVSDMIYAGITDEAAVSACVDVGVGGTVAFEIGGKLDSSHCQPLPVSGVVSFIKRDATNPQAVIDVGGIHIILTARRTAFHLRRQFADLDLVPEAHQIVAVKIGYLEPELKAMAADACLALSPGAVDQDIASLAFKRVRRPFYPLDADMRWTPAVEVL